MDWIGQEKTDITGLALECASINAFGDAVPVPGVSCRPRKPPRTDLSCEKEGPAFERDEVGLNARCGENVACMMHLRLRFVGKMRRLVVSTLTQFGVTGRREILRRTVPETWVHGYLCEGLAEASPHGR